MWVQVPLPVLITSLIVIPTWCLRMGIFDMETKRKIELRYKANSLLNTIISTIISNSKDLRFIQILRALGIIDRSKEEWGKSSQILDRFYEEPVDTLIRIRCCPEISKNLRMKIDELLFD